MILFECLAGRRPFQADSAVATALAHIREPIPDLPADVPALLVTITRRAMAKDPAQRYADAGQMAAALAGEEVADQPTQVVPAAPVAVPPSDATQVLPPTQTTPVSSGYEPPYEPADDEQERKSPLPMVLIGLLVVALVIAAIYLLTRGDGDNEQPTEPTTSETTPTSSPTESTPETVNVNADDYVGRDADEAAADLRQLGFNVTQRTVDNPGGEDAGTVSAVDPTGDVPSGSTITLSVWGEPRPEEPTETPTPTPTPPAVTPTETPTVVPTNGEGAAE